MSRFDFIEEALSEREGRGQRRHLRRVLPFSGPVIQLDGKRLINFCSNDYLGLSQHPILRERAEAFMSQYGAGATASRLICGNMGCFDPVERKLAELKGTETALIFNSGFQTNVSLLPTLADRRSLILSDRLNHSSLIMGAMLSRCRVVQFHHNDMNHLRQLLDESQGKNYSRIFIVTESVFSMDGDRSDIAALTELSRAYDAILYLDEAHATGVLGNNGMGLSCGNPVDIVMGTFSKGCGCFGAYVACSQQVRDYMINYCPGLMYSTGLPPGVVGAIDAALDLLPGMEKERQQIHDNAHYLKDSLESMGWHTGESNTQIIPVMIGKEKETLALSNWLEEKGMMATAIRPPTVPDGESRIRLTVSALHTKAHLTQLLDGFHSWKKST